MKTIAIIPAKGNSERCPGKNLRSFLGYPLFLYSVFYAQSEGITPVVSTDSDEIAQICKNYGINVVREQVDDSTMSNCVRQVLQQAACDVFAILMPTSPLRQRGLLRQMLSACLHGSCESAFTACDMKIIGQLGGRFRRAYRDQDAKERFLFFDGNIAVTSRAFFESSGELFDDHSRPFVNSFPCTMQIDTENEFAVLERVASQARFREFLPKNVRRICVVSNRPWFMRNYSAFVDSCDLVVRISKMENLDSGLSGSRTDMAVVSCWREYMNYSAKARKVDVLRSLPSIYFEPFDIPLTRRFCRSENLQNWAFIPQEPNKRSHHFSTFGKAVVLMNWLYPQAHIFCLGDMNVALRTGYCSKHVRSSEMECMRFFQDKGILTWILEDSLDSATGAFSTGISECMREQAMMRQLYFVPSSLAHRVVNVSHPKWKDSLRLTDSVACRVHGGDAARVLSFDGNSLCLKWERWGVETFSRVSDSQFVLSSNL